MAKGLALISDHALYPTQRSHILRRTEARIWHSRPRHTRKGYHLVVLARPGSLSFNVNRCDIYKRHVCTPPFLLARYSPGFLRFVQSLASIVQPIVAAMTHIRDFDARFVNAQRPDLACRRGKERMSIKPLPLGDPMRRPSTSVESASPGAPPDYDVFTSYFEASHSQHHAAGGDLPLVHEHKHKQAQAGSTHYPTTQMGIRTSHLEQNPSRTRPLSSDPRANVTFQAMQTPGSDNGVRKPHAHSRSQAGPLGRREDLSETEMVDFMTMVHQRNLPHNMTNAAKTIDVPMSDEAESPPGPVRFLKSRITRARALDPSGPWSLTLRGFLTHFRLAEAESKDPSKEVTAKLPGADSATSTYALCEDFLTRADLAIHVKTDLEQWVALLVKMRNTHRERTTARRREAAEQRANKDRGPVPVQRRTYRPIAPAPPPPHVVGARQPGSK